MNYYVKVLGRNAEVVVDQIVGEEELMEVFKCLKEDYLDFGGFTVEIILEGDRCRI